MLQVNVISGDITKMDHPVDAIATLVSSRGDWLEGVHLSIKRNCGHFYHVKLGYELELIDDEEEQSQDGKVHIIKNERSTRDQSFKDVIFTIDESKLPLTRLVFNTLKAADLAGYQRIAIPPMRISTNSHPVDVFDAVLSIKHGIHEFKKQYPESDMILDIVVDNDPTLQQYIQDNVSD